MITTSDTRLTVTSHPSREQRGPLSCHGVWKIICVNSNVNLLCKTHQLITTLQTGTSIAKLWLEWTASVADQRTGEQPATLTKCKKRLTSKITWEESSATRTSWRIIVTDNVCQWITWMFVDIQRVVPQQGSIRLRTLTPSTFKVHTPAVPSMLPLELVQVKTTLVTTALSTKISAAPWQMILQPNGGSVVTWLTERFN